MHAKILQYLCAGIAALLIGAGETRAPRAGDLNMKSPPMQTMSSELDGMIFVGEFGSARGGVLTDDTFVFENGTFMSMQCRDCGYPRGVYQSSKTDYGATFVAETPCPKTDARIVWRGVIHGNHVEGTATWTKKRWYRSIEKTFWFKGTLKSSRKREPGR